VKESIKLEGLKEFLSNEPTCSWLRTFHPQDVRLCRKLVKKGFDKKTDRLW